MTKLVLKTVAKEFNIFDYLDYKSYLKDLYMRSKNLNSNYSYIHFSNDIGLSETNVSSHIIQGRRPLSTDAAKKVVNALGLVKLSRRYFLALVDYMNESDSGERDAKFAFLFTLKQESLPDVLQEQMTYCSEWYYPILGELARVDSFQSNYKWVKSNLWPKITPSQYEMAINFLEKVRILSKDKSTGEFKRTDLDFSTGNSTKNISVMKYHKQMLKLAEQGLSAIKEKKRNFSSITVVVGKDEAKQINQMVIEFQRKLLELEAKCENRKDIYQINIQLFPFTKGDDLWS